MKYKVILITDLHAWDKNIGNHINYDNEIRNYAERIRDEGIKFADTHEVVFLFMGDVFYKGISDYKFAIWWNNFFLELNSIGQVYSLVGNHELSYQKNNMFWDLVQKGNHHLALGQMPLISITNTLALGDVSFHMFHFDRSIEDKLELNKVNIGLYHKDLMDDTVAGILKRKYETDLLTQYIHYRDIKELKNISCMDKCYFGHMHKAFGTFTMINRETNQQTELVYLASLGRTNKIEVMELDNIRRIPVIEIDDGNVSYDYFELELLDFKQCMDLVALEKQEEKTEEQKIIKSAKLLKSYTSEPLEELKGIFQDDLVKLEWISCSERNETPQQLSDYRRVLT